MYVLQFLEQACIAFLHPEILVHKWQVSVAMHRAKGEGSIYKEKSGLWLPRSPFLTENANTPFPLNLLTKEKPAPEDRAGKVRAFNHIPYSRHLHPCCTQHAAASLGRDVKLFPGGGIGVAITPESPILPETAELKHPYIWEDDRQNSHQWTYLTQRNCRTCGTTYLRN